MTTKTSDLANHTGAPIEKLCVNGPLDYLRNGLKQYTELGLVTIENNARSNMGVRHSDYNGKKGTSAPYSHLMRMDNHNYKAATIIQAIQDEMRSRKVKRDIKPVTAIHAKCRVCAEFHENNGDSYCKHKGYWFEIHHIDTGDIVERKTISHRKIAYCRKFAQKFEQKTMFGG